LLDRDRRSVVTRPVASAARITADAVSRSYRRAAATLGRYDFLASNRPVSGRQELLWLTLLPTLTFVAVFLLAALAGVAYRPGCNSATNFIANLTFQAEVPSTCRSVPFISDIPMIILSFTSPFALVTYRLLRRRLASLVEALKQTGLLDPKNAPRRFTLGMAHLERALDLTPVWRISIFVTSMAMVTWLYSRDLVDGHLFNTLESTKNGVEFNARDLRETWWANYHHHPLLAALCIFVGSVGVTYALRSGWLFVRLGIVLFVTLNAPPDSLPVRFVPKWKDRSYGWSPVTGVLMLVYVSTTSFAFSMVSVYDMLRNESWTLWVCMFFMALGILSNTTIILTSFYRMIAAHRAVKRRLRTDLSDGLAHGSEAMTSPEYVIAASELTTWRKIPVASFSGSAIKVLPGLYALFQFARVFYK
jgi:hypothetical protein